MELLATIAVPVTDEQRVALLRIENEDFSALAKKMKKDFGFSEEQITAGILGLKQYYAVALLDSKNMHAVSDVVDPFWHTHVLFTREYVRFCEDSFGYYLHHEPLDHDNVEKLNAAERLYNYTVGIYDKLFSFHEIEPLPRSRIICVHFGSTIHTKMYDQGLFPANPLMQAA